MTRIDHTHQHLRYPDRMPSAYGHILRSLPREARALVFTIFVLACALLCFALLTLLAGPRRAPQTDDGRARVEQELRISPRVVPEA